MPAAPNLPEKIIRYIEASSALAEKAAAADAERARMEKHAGTLVPEIVETLLKIQIQGDGGPVPLLEPDEKAACAEALRDPVRALEVFTKVAAHFRRDQADRLGRPAPGREKR